jgi:hypothetical protein
VLLFSTALTHVSCWQSTNRCVRLGSFRYGKADQMCDLTERESYDMLHPG